ncbi:MAG: hypothetical protein WCO58_02570 [bacterium]
MSHSKIRSLLFLSVFVALGFSFATNTFAIGPSFNFGGKIRQLNNTAESQVACGAQYGPMTIAPIGSKFIILPFFVSESSKTLRAGQQILGRYSIDYNTCYNTETGAFVPSWSIAPKRFNVSR